MLEIGSQGSTDGWWAITISADGTQLGFVTQAGGVAINNLNALVSWNSNAWHQIALTYSPTNSCLFLDGQAVVTNGVGVANCLDAAALSSGFSVGSDNSGNYQARGVLDELETFSYQLDAASISQNFNEIDGSGTGPVDYIENLEGRNPSVHGAAVPDLGNLVQLLIYTPLW